MTSTKNIENTNTTNTTNTNNNWLVKYDIIYNIVIQEDIFNKHIGSLKTENICINTFIDCGNTIRDYIKITNSKVEIDDLHNIKVNLYILLACIISYNELKNKKTCEITYEICRDLFSRKNSDYGDAFVDYGAIGILMRLNDKIRRLKSLNKKNNINFESIEDTILDSFNYVILGLMLLNDKS